jgi:Flp pilus assembly CpaE family ATPase
MKKKKHIRVLLVEDDTICARIVEAMLSRAEGQTFQVQRAETLTSALDLLARDALDVALLDLSLPDSQGLHTFRTVQRHAPTLPVIILSGMDDESVALTAVQQGAQDFLPKASLKKEMLVRVLNYAIARSRNPSEAAVRIESKAQVVGLLGSNGGVGTTTLACHCALELSQTGKRVLFLDLDVSSAGASFLMKASSAYTVLDATQNLHRLDTNFWRGIVSSPQERIDLLQAPGAIAFSDPLDTDRVRHVLRYAQSQYEWIVVDLGRLTASKLAILEETRDVFVVTTPQVPALFETIRILQRLVDAGFPPEKIKLLLNRKAKGINTTVDELEKALGHSFYGAVADHSAEMSEAYAQGRFLDENLLVRKQIAQVIRKWRGVEEKPPARFGLRFLRPARTGD